MTIRQRNKVLVILILIIGILLSPIVPVQGATTQSKQMKKLQQQIDELTVTVNSLQGELDGLYTKVNNQISSTLIPKDYIESDIAYLHVDRQRPGSRFCPSGSFDDFIGLTSLGIPYRNLGESSGTYRNNLDVIVCNVTVLTKKK